ncbi:cytochrome C oxidase subunit I [Streptomyces sp. NPDC048419]|uniref:cytochrome C oxidase subunit I n=1 Tax=Streptomyces sp. NPDC048419 TaxID=3365547 RepID=UPI00371C70A1
MTDPAGRTDRKSKTPAALVNQVEGYLLLQARSAEAAQRARAFTEPLHWLTTSQREEIQRHYTLDCLTRTRADLQQLANRAQALRNEYEARYRRLRARCGALLITMLSAMALLMLYRRHS